MASNLIPSLSLLTRVRATRCSNGEFGWPKNFAQGLFLCSKVDKYFSGSGLYLLCHGGWLSGPNNAFREPINTYLLSDPIDRGEHDLPVTFSFEGLARSRSCSCCCQLTTITWGVREAEM